MTNRIIPEDSRFIPIAFLGPNGLCDRLYNEGSRTFEEIWRLCSDNASHIVMEWGGVNDGARYIVTDRFTSLLLEDAHIKLGPFEWFDHLDTAMMAASMQASRGSARSEFAHLVGTTSFDNAIGDSDRDRRLISLYCKTRPWWT